MSKVFLKPVFTSVAARSTDVKVKLSVFRISMNAVNEII